MLLTFCFSRNWIEYSDIFILRERPCWPEHSPFAQRDNLLLVHFALEKKFHPLAATQLAYRAGISCHNEIILLIYRPVVKPQNHFSID